uniref:Uncharacterized protein n=1 Tax=Chromera velia CCMP2878 TaxID=1169474 RepID=A0A0G4I502_9ALVE|eukprot:Cvel_11055.t1-p1 / transcript=Cvel_11055.t1 / gene=Cvel_11055 / organism=Chromera_velia_CCMP2878 / gene_product=hypothetical protein / transcript_product=hypothetical protein / location=Cvel_scaffold681:66741-72250(+) / protein_length=374 / sequence_SO=supercontig / SO=protein_coding / is_pseudo=false
MREGSVRVLVKARSLAPSFLSEEGNSAGELFLATVADRFGEPAHELLPPGTEVIGLAVTGLEETNTASSSFSKDAEEFSSLSFGGDEDARREVETEVDTAFLVRVDGSREGCHRDPPGKLPSPSSNTAGSRSSSFWGLHVGYDSSRDRSGHGGGPQGREGGEMSIEREGRGGQSFSSALGVPPEGPNRVLRPPLPAPPAALLPFLRNAIDVQACICERLRPLPEEQIVVVAQRLNSLKLSLIVREILRRTEGGAVVLLYVLGRAEGEREKGYGEAGSAEEEEEEEEEDLIFSESHGESVLQTFLNLQHGEAPVAGSRARRSPVPSGARLSANGPAVSLRGPKGGGGVGGEGGGTSVGGECLGGNRKGGGVAVIK